MVPAFEFIERVRPPLNSLASRRRTCWPALERAVAMQRPERPLPTTTVSKMFFLLEMLIGKISAAYAAIGKIKLNDERQDR